MSMMDSGAVAMQTLMAGSKRSDRQHLWECQDEDEIAEMVSRAGGGKEENQGRTGHTASGVELACPGRTKSHPPSAWEAGCRS